MTLAERFVTNVIHSLTVPLHSNVSKLFALTGAFPGSHIQLYEDLKREGHTAIVLRPPTPWEPLAPLRHLCEHWQRPLPQFEPFDCEPASFWLGIQSIRSRYFVRAVESLQGCPTLAWIEASDLEAPVWGEFLRLVQQEQLKIPVSFVFPLSTESFAGHGIRRLTLPENPSASASQPFGPTLPKRLAGYVSQSLLLGETITPQLMCHISRANHEKNVMELQRLDVIDAQGNIQPEQLRFSGIPSPPSSKSWRAKAHRQLFRMKLDHAPKAMWLSTNTVPILRQYRYWDEEAVGQAMLSLGEPCIQSFAHHLNELPMTEEAKVSVCLAISRLPESELPNIHDLSLSSPWKSLLKARWIGQQPKGRIETLNECMREVVATKTTWPAALIATELAQWHLALGRIQFVFSLLKPHTENENWVIQWLTRTLFAKAFARMGRLDLARNSLEQAAANAPKPISPVLAAELRLLTSYEFAGREDSQGLQHNDARDVFRAAGDGVRLGRFLLVAAEGPWRRSQWTDARNLLARSLDLFRRYRDGLGLQETQLKLGLVIKERPINVLQAGD